MVKILYNNIATLLAIFIKIIQACNEHPETQMIQKEISDSDEEYQSNYDEINDEDYDSPRDYRQSFTTTYQTITINSTIICTNIFSLEQITYDYQERNYPQFLKITNSNISTVPSQVLSKFTTITKLYMSHLNVHHVIPGAFNGLSRLQELYLDNNELTELSKGVYNSLHRLEILNLTNNKIQKIEEYSFIGLTNLNELYLKNNQILKIENGLFETQKHLKYLDLSGNPLEEFSDESLASLDNLILTKTSLHEFDLDLSNNTMKLLDLSSSQLSTVDFANFPKANRVDLSQNQIIEIENCDYLDSLYVDLRNNQLITINGTFNDVSELYLGHNNLTILKESTFDKTLFILDVSFNKINEIEKGTFDDLISLNKLLLQGNKLVKIDPSLLKNLSNLKYLNLSNNNIKEFQFGTFDNLNNLNTLDVSNNHLIDLHQYTFKSLFKLTHLYFDNNEISSVHVNDLWDHLRELKFISFNNNPWNCKDLVQISHYLKKNHVRIAEGDDYDSENYHGIACSNQKKFTNALNNVSIKDLAKDIFKSINGGFKNSKISNSFNEDFQESKLFQYFHKDYLKSNFFKYLENYEFITVNQPVLNNSKIEKLTSLQVTPNENNNKIFILIAIFLVIITFIILCLMFLINFFKKANCNQKSELTTSSQIELC